MKSRLSSPVWVGLMCGAVGIGIGLLIGVIIGGNISAPWLGGAAGAVAAIIAVSNLVWSVTAKNEDRAIEQRHRDEDAETARRAEAEAVTRAAQAAADAARQAEQGAARDAAQVIVRLVGGGGYGQESEFRMNSLNLHLLNGTNRPISQITVEVQGAPPVTRKRGAFDDAPELLGPGAQHQWNQQIEDLEVPRSEATGNPMSTHLPVITFWLDGRHWQRVGDEPPQLLEG